MNAPASWQAAVPTSYARPALAGLLALLAFGAGFGVWAATAPLAGAVVAMGVMQASGRNQVVDHLDGGIIASIPVREGQWVRSGDALLMIDTARTAADRDRVNMALVGARSQLARAQAELDGRESLSFDADLEVTASAAGLAQDLAQQRAEFESRLVRHRAEAAALEERIRAAREEIGGLGAQKRAEERKLAMFREDLAYKSSLLEKGLIARGEVSALRRAEADAIGATGSITARIAERRSAIAELHQQRAALSARRRETASAEINELSARISDLRQQLRRHDDILARSVVRSPETGIIVKLAKNTVGSALKPGEPVAEILPTGEELVVEVRVAPQDVDLVKVGQAAGLRLLALNARTTPEARGEVTYVSADSIADPSTRESHYAARIRLESLPEGVQPGQLLPGMPVEAFIRTGERTFLAYLVRPLLDNFARAFREE